MQPEISQKLLDINYQFYQTFAAAFSRTRARVQPGVRRALGLIPLHGNWLDIGCGNGTVARAWAADGRTGRYQGLDFSAGLLEEARTLQGSVPEGLQIEFAEANLSEPGWTRAVQDGDWDGALAFAVLHHLPGMELRQRVLADLASLLQPGALFILSNWQFANSDRWLARVQPWSLAGIDEHTLEPGDTLLDWRASLPGQPEQVGLRYVHLFTRAELNNLAESAGFEVQDAYESDGSNGRLGLYQVWRKVA